MSVLNILSLSPLPKAGDLRALGAVFTVGALLLAPTMPAKADDWVISSAEASIPKKTMSLGSEAITFSIKPQPLTSALDAFGIATGIELLYSAALTNSRHSPGVTGSFTPEEALQQLLADTGLQFAQTAPHAIKLVADAPDVHAPSVLEASTPQLALSPLHIQASPFRDFQPYAIALRFAIQDAIRRDISLRRGKYRAVLDVWVSASGAVQHSQYLSSTGDSELDGAIMGTVQKVVLQQSPPSDLPQPVHVWILTGSKDTPISEASR